MTQEKINKAMEAELEEINQISGPKTAQEVLELLAELNDD